MSRAMCRTGRKAASAINQVLRTATGWYNPPMLIPFTAAYDLGATLCGGQAFRWRAEPDSWFCGVIFGNVVRMRKLAAGIEFVCAPDDAESLAPLVRDYLRLDEDVNDICAALSAADDHLADAVKRHGGLRLLRQEAWECLVSYICSATNSIPRISANVEAMATAFGKPLPYPALPPSAGGSAASSDSPSNGAALRSSFPSPGALADAGEQALRDLGLGFRAAYVAAAAEGIASTGSPDLYALREADYDNALDALVSLNGVGDKIANCVMMFALDKPQAFPVDVWIVRALRQWYADAPTPPAINRNGKRTSPTGAQIRHMRLWAQEQFGMHAGYANQYIFHHQRWLEGKGTD